MYSPYGPQITADQLRSAFDNLEQPSKGVIDTQIDRLDTSMRRRKGDYTEKLRGKRVTKTQFGIVSGLEVLAKLGIFLSRLEEKDPDQWKRFLKWSNREASKERFAARKLEEGHAPNYFPTGLKNAPTPWT